MRRTIETPHKYKMIFSDIDGTLLDSNQKISFDTKKKIQELAKKGIPFVLASSRLESGVFPVMEELGIKAPAISYSGALVHDADRKVIVWRCRCKRRRIYTHLSSKQIKAFVVVHTHMIYG